MGRFVLRRLAQSAVIVFLVATLTFVLLRMAPGDPVRAQFRDVTVSQEVIDEYRRSWGLDRSMPVQYVQYLGNLIRGDFGQSFSLHRPAWDVIREALPNTVVLALAALGISFATGMVLGTAQGANPNSRMDHTLTVITLAVFSIPIFWLGLMFMLVFGQWMGWFPIGGEVSPVYRGLPLVGQLADRFRHLVLPALTLGLGGAAVVARFHRAAMAEAFAENFIRTARAKGLSEQTVVLKHALRNALLPAITMFGLSLPVLFSGSVLVEYVFAWHGMGLAAFEAVGRRDYNVVTAITMIGATLVVAGNMVADLLYRLADPRTAES
ncbi:MAG: ABC transporter permease [Gemmatimonadetes bacterium]|nr:ABC transporter permease [Gemmatimonadota bacterium]